MKNVRAIHLIYAVLLLGVLGFLSTELALRDHESFEVARTIAYLMFLLNLAVAAFGAWMQHRAAWLAYLIVSLACMVLIGAATPVSAVWMLAKIL